MREVKPIVCEKCGFPANESGMIYCSCFSDLWKKTACDYAIEEIAKHADDIAVNGLFGTEPECDEFRPPRFPDDYQTDIQVKNYQDTNWQEDLLYQYDHRQYRAWNCLDRSWDMARVKK